MSKNNNEHIKDFTMFCIVEHNETALDFGSLQALQKYFLDNPYFFQYATLISIYDNKHSKSVIGGDEIKPFFNYGAKLVEVLSALKKYYSRFVKLNGKKKKR